MLVAQASEVLVVPGRFIGWVERFTASHGATALALDCGALTGAAVDGSTFRARPAYDAAPAEATPEAVTQASEPPADWGVLLVRKGGFAIARLEADRIVESKVGQRHVQGRTKAGGQSQQRFARRRDNQARQAYEAAAGHATRILGPTQLLVTGGDRSAVGEVLDLIRFSGSVVAPWLDVPDPRRAVLEKAVVDAGSIRVSVTNAS